MGRIIATIEARMTSSRLPGKVLKEASGKTMLEILITRLKEVSQLEKIVVATTVNETDDPIVAAAERLQVECFRGSENDVLSRVLQAAQSCEADIITEITGDCPLVDPEIISQAIELYCNNECDYVSNVEPVTYPIGMDVQVFSSRCLEIADREGKTPEDREHVSWFIRKNPKRFKQININAPAELSWSDLALTLDEASDYILLKNIIEYFSPDLLFSCRQIIDYLRGHPELLNINQDVVRR